ncbi:MAG: DUF1847 domain-containing protein [Bacillota bacterium]
MQCDLCKNEECRQGKDCPGNKKEAVNNYTGEDRELHKASTFIEGEYYMQKTRVEELILFSREMGYEKLGVAFCIGLKEEAKVLCGYLRNNNFQVYSVCCKVCGISKDELGLKKIKDDQVESMCNPISQAGVFQAKNTDLNITVGLCVGHDILFNKHSAAPVTALVVKDRVLSHNPAGALYTGYYKKLLGKEI